MEVINEYTPESVIRNFIDLDSKLADHFDLLVTDYFKMKTSTPRGMLHHRIAYRDIFYYISWLYDNNPSNVIDFGSGDGVFKKWFPNIYTADITAEFANWNQPDEVIVHSVFYKKYFEKFDCGMALNSLHFQGFDTFIHQVLRCMTLIKPGGRFLFTINYSAAGPNGIQRGPLDYRGAALQEKIEEADNKLFEYFTNSNYKIILFDPFTSRGRPRPGPIDIRGQYAPINGDTRFILEK